MRVLLQEITHINHSFISAVFAQGFSPG